MENSEDGWRIVMGRQLVALGIRQAARLPKAAVPVLLGVAVGALECLLAGDPIVRVAADSWQVTAAGFIVAAGTSGEFLTHMRRLVLLGSTQVTAIAGALAIPRAPAAEVDWLYLSGVLAWTIGIALSEGADELFNRTLRSLVASGVARVTGAELRAIRCELRGKKSLYRRKGGVWLATVMALAWIAFGAAWLVSSGGVADLRYLPLLLVANPGIVLFEVLAAAAAGQYIGEMVAYAAAWRALQPGLRLVPGHPDGTGGLKMIGRFYFRQAVIAGMPAAYLATWWYLIPAFPQYAHWRNVYLGLLAVAIAIEVLAFFLPMRAVHQALAAERQRRGLEADRLTRRIAALQEGLVSTADHEARDKLSKELAILLEWVRTLRLLPSWPVDPPLRRWFTLSNAALFVPFLSYVLGNPRLWSQVASILGGLKH
jgi:hypothetical protein